MRRREFLTLLAGCVLFGAVRSSAQAQVQAQMPVIGFLSSRSQTDSANDVAEFRQGLRDLGYAEGQNVYVEYRWADGEYDRLSALASDLVRSRVSVIVTTGGIVSARAAKAATSSIPIVFTVGDDPVRYGLVASLNRPGGNATGIVILVSDLGSKRLEMIHELVPRASAIAVLVNPSNPNVESQTEGLQSAATILGIRLHVFSARDDPDIGVAFDALVRERISALLVTADPFFASRRDQLVRLATRHAVPAIYEGREFAEAGGLVSYGPSRKDARRLAGVYAGRILLGALPSEIPVQAPTRFELVINLKTANALGLTIPPTLLARADEVIE
jgi:putative ABC transport system substrate-binding protein